MADLLLSDQRYIVTRKNSIIMTLRFARPHEVLAMRNNPCSHDGFSIVRQHGIFIYETYYCDVCGDFVGLL